MKAQIRETNTISLPEKRIWIVSLQRDDESRKVAFQFKTKAAAKMFKKIHDENMPTMSIVDGNHY
ncbi:MAG: hypothetical protein KAS32_08640 [Candidatus Peribacteraceae bacterium]|nr:hypothetical protein [Candidatus Peribacteraceae bacterium]